MRKLCVTRWTVPATCFQNLTKTLPEEQMSAVSRQNLANLTIHTLKNVRNNGDFLFFFEMAKRAASKINKTWRLSAAKKARKSKFFDCYPSQRLRNQKRKFHGNCCWLLKQIYFEAPDVVLNLIKDSFNQPQSCS